MKHQHPCTTCHRKTACFVTECVLASKTCPACDVEKLVEQRATHAARVDHGLKEAQATLAEIWRRHSDAGNESMKMLAWDALGAVIEAATTMRAADRLNQAGTRKERAEAQRALYIACAPRSVSAKIMLSHQEAIERDLQDRVARGDR